MKAQETNVLLNAALSEAALGQVTGGQSIQTEGNEAAEAKGFFKFKKKKFFHHHYHH